MADILAFPTEAPDASLDCATDDRFLIDEGLELLGDFRAIEDRDVRDSLRALVKSMALASGRGMVAGG